MSKLDFLITQLESYNTDDREQINLRQDFLIFIKENPECLFRSNHYGHLTASAWVVDNNAHNKVLLVKHKKLDCWLQPGGHADGNQNLIEVASQELYEETGLSANLVCEQIFDLDRHKIPDYKDVAGHFHYDLRFLFTCDENQGLIISDESQAIDWFEFSELKALGCDQSILRMAQKSIEYFDINHCRK